MSKHCQALMLALALASAGAVVMPAPAAAQDAAAAREIEVVVEGAYRPSRIVVTEGDRVRLRFVRRDRSPCTREVVFPALNIRRALPTNQPVTIDLPALAAGEYEFRCGMNMIRGTLVVQPRPRA